MIIVGGYNVYPREIEEVLYLHPEIAEAVVIGVPDPNTGEAVQCYVVPKNKTLTEDDVLSHCKKHLAKYKRPAAIVFMDEIPKKFDRQNFKARFKRHFDKSILTR